MDSDDQISNSSSPDQDPLKNAREELRALRDRIDSILAQPQSETPITKAQKESLFDNFARANSELITKQRDRYKDHFGYLVSHFPYGIVGVTDSDYRIEYIDGEGLEAVGLKAEELIGEILPDLNPSKPDRKLLVESFQETLSGKPQNFKVNYGNHYFQLHTSLLNGSLSENHKISFLAWDITTERVGNIKLQTALDASGVIIAEYDFQNGHFKYNEALYDLIGWPKGRLLSMEEFYAHYYEEDRLKREKKIAENGVSGLLNYDTRIHTPEGTKWIRIAGSNIPDADGNPQLGVAAILDITKDKELIENARMSEERFRLIADSAPVMIWTSNADKESTYLNPKWLEFTGRELEEDLGDGWLDHLHPDEKDAFITYRDEAFRTKESFTSELRFRRRDGEYRWVLNNGVPMFDSEGTFLGFIGSCVDITTQKELAEELEKRVAERTKQLAQTNKELADLNMNLEEYAHAASHDLQEPLRKIEMFLSIAQDASTDPARSRKYLSKVKETAKRMRELVKDILSFSSIGNTSQKFTEVDLDLLLEDLSQDFELLIKESKARVNRRKLGFISGDRVKLNQLFANLLKNALTYNEKPPEIEIKICELPEDLNGNGNLVVKDGTKYKCISVKDNGIGFDPDHAETILKPFQRLNSRDKYPGTGLGLSIVNRIVELHKGFLEIQSEPEKGSEFKVYLPVVHEAT